MLIDVPANGTTASIVSIPRDSDVTIPGYGNNKIDSAYSASYANVTDYPTATWTVSSDSSSSSVR